MSLSPKATIFLWGAAAAVLGSAFPLAAWMWAAGGLLTIESVVASHQEQPVLFIIDSAPIVLAFAGLLAGSLHARLHASYRRCEATVFERTAELQSVNNHLVDVIAAKDRLVGTVSHELRTPLTGVVGFAQMLQTSNGRLDDPESREAIELIIGQGSEAALLIDDLLVASRAETSSLSIDRRNLDLAEVASECARVVLTPGGQRLANSTRLDAAHVIADPGRVRQISRNLLTNAIRYGGTSIWIRTWTGTDGHCYLQVWDNGDGVPEHESNVIFEPYTHSDSTRTVSGSSGIGLSVSKTLARLMDGELTYRREHDNTVFELRLPAAASTPSRTAA